MSGLLFVLLTDEFEKSVFPVSINLSVSKKEVTHENVE